MMNPARTVAAMVAVMGLASLGAEAQTVVIPDGTGGYTIHDLTPRVEPVLPPYYYTPQAPPVIVNPPPARAIAPRHDYIRDPKRHSADLAGIPPLPNGGTDFTGLDYTNGVWSYRGQTWDGRRWN